MEHEGVVPAEGCPHYITKARQEAWQKQRPGIKSRCKSCAKDGFVPTQRLRATRRHVHDAERPNPGPQVDRHLA